MSLIAELKRRNVFRVAAGYAVVAWVLVQVATTVLPQFGAPEWIARCLIVALAIGFMPALAFGWMYELTPEGLKTQGEADAAGLASRFSGARGNLAIALILVLGLALFALGRYSAAPGGGEAAAGAPSIAVLPFVNMSADKENVYFSDGLSETLLDMLAQVPALKVSARTSSFAFRDKAEDVRSIGAALGVAHLLEGSVQKAGDQVRITAQLVRTSDGAHVWSRRFDRQLTDVFKIQDEIATEVVSALRVALVGGAGQRLTQKRTEDVEAYQEYLKGLALMPQRKVAGLKQAALHFERAIELDAGFARAYVGASDAYMLLADYGSVDAEQRTRVQRYLDRALQLAPELGEAHASLAIQKGQALDFVAAEREFLRAIELAPSYATAHHWYSMLLRGLGRDEDALRETRAAVALDPLAPVLRVNLADTLYALGRGAEAHATLLQVAASHPEYASVHRSLAQDAARAGDLVAALGAMRDHDRADPEGVGYGTERCEILEDFLARAEARACAEEFARRGPDQVRIRTLQAHWATLEGDLQKALALHEATPNGDRLDHAVTLLRLGRASDALAKLAGIFPRWVEEPVPEVTWRDHFPAFLVGVTLTRIEGGEAHGRQLMEASLAAARQRPGEAAEAAVSPWFEATCLELLGRRDEAMASLQRQVAGGRFLKLDEIDWEPILAPLRADPRYEAIVAPARAKAAEQVRLARDAGLL